MELHRVGIVMEAFSGTCLRGRIVNSGARLAGEKPNKEPTLTSGSPLVSGGKPGSTSSHHDSPTIVGTGAKLCFIYHFIEMAIIQQSAASQ